MEPGFKALDFFLLRTPRLPSSVIHKLNGLDSKEAAWDYVNELLSDPEILDAIYFASEDLFHEVTNHHGSEYTSSKSKLLASLYKYVNRMAGRSTPYGKFAGVAVGEVGEVQTCLELSGEYVQSYRPDMAYISYLIGMVSQERPVQDQLTYYSNNTLCEGYDRYHYIEFMERGDRRFYNWAWVEKNPVLDHILHVAKGGARLSELAESLCLYGVERYRAFEYLYGLIEAGLLISELESAVTKNVSAISITRLKELRQRSVPTTTWDILDGFLKKANNRKINVETSKANKHLCELDRGPSKNLFQVDLCMGTSSNQIHRGVIQELTKELEELSVLNSPRSPAELQSFSRKFHERYDDMEIPLMEALDPERGIGYGTASGGVPEDHPLLLGLGTGRANINKAIKNKLIQSIMDRYQSTDTTLTPSIVLDERDIQSFRLETTNRHQNYPAGFYALGNLLTFGQGIDKGDYLFNVLATGGTSAIPLMTRFAHLDSGLEERLRECVRMEERQQDDGIFAEVVCLPESRAGNILTRPSLFKYEIPIIGQSAVKEAYRIYLDDLLLSVKNGEIILRSKRLNKRVIPRLSSAHNFHYGMVVYRFLCDLQYQSGTLNLSWDWGTLAENRFNPRVSYKHIIVARAKWNIPKEIFQRLKKDDAKYSISILKEIYKLPDMVSLTDGDNELILDLRSPLAAEILLKQLEKNDIVLQEYLFESYQSPLTGAKQEQFSNEIIIPFSANKSLNNIRSKPSIESKIKRTFQPGSEWAYIKIYSGVMECERLLRSQIPRLISDLKKAGIVEKWFFIRYNDPDPHIRLRFLLRAIDGQLPFQQLTEYLNQHLATLLENRIIHRLIYDTYDRELERYGPENMEICESIFHADSEDVLSLLPLFKRKDGKHLRWLSGMLGVDKLLTAFGLDIPMKISLMTSLRDAFLEEFSDYGQLKYKMDMKYRENRLWIEKFFDLAHEDAYEAHAILSKRMETIQEIIKPLDGLDRDNYFELLSSLSHMFINRIFPIKQREQEMVIYHFLTKHYISMTKRERSDRCPIQPNHYQKEQVF